MALDFAKLNDPAWREQVRLEREAEQEKAQAHEKKLRQAVNLCLEANETLTENERSLVRNCRTRLNACSPVSASQEKWLLDIAKRVREQLADKVNVLVMRYAKGDPNGEHPRFPRSEWPLASEAGTDAADYWVWVLRLVEALEPGV